MDQTAFFKLSYGLYIISTTSEGKDAGCVANTLHQVTSSPVSYTHLDVYKRQDGILIIASNPVDGMTYLAQKVSGLPKERVIGSGTILDTARLRYMMSEYLDVSSSNMHAYIMGEHGDSSFVPWTHAYVGSKSLLELLDEKGKPLSDLHDIYTNVQQAAYEIINRKKATFYGIGLSLNRLVHAVLDDENAILTVSAYQEGEYQQKGLYIGVPAVVNREGIREVIRLKLNEVDQAKFDSSCRTLKEINRDIIDPLL